MPVLRERKQYQSAGPVGVLRVNTGEQGKYQAISNAADKLTKLAVGEMSRSSKIMGAQKAQEVSDVMTIDPKTGKPQALNWSERRQFFGRDSAEAYQRVITERFQQEIAVEIREKAAQLAIEHENDPYSVEKYEDKMNAYLAAMAETNSVDGKETAYTNYIMSQGAEYISKTTLAMQAERKRREDAKTAILLMESSKEKIDVVRTAAMQGYDTGAIIEALEQSNLDGERSGILKQGTAKLIIDQANVAYAEGILISKMANLSPTSAIRLAYAFKTLNPSDLNDSERKIWDQATYKLYRAAEMPNGEIASVLDFDAAAPLGEFASLQANQIASNTAGRLAAKKSLDQIISQELTDATESSILNAILKAFDGSLPFDQAVSSFEREFYGELGVLKARAIDPDANYSSSAFEADKNQLIVSASKALVISAYNSMKGRPDDNKNKILTALMKKNYEDLPEGAGAIVQSLNKINNDITKKQLHIFVRDLASADARNSVEKKRELTAKQISLADNLLRYFEDTDFDQSIYADAEWQEYLNDSKEKITNLDLLSGNQVASYHRKLNEKASIEWLSYQLKNGYENDDGDTVDITTGDLVLMTSYSGGNDEDLPPELKQIINTAHVMSENKNAITAKLSSLKTLASQVDTIEASTIDADAVMIALSSGIPVDDSAKNKGIIEDAIVRSSKLKNESVFFSKEILQSQSLAGKLLLQSLISGVMPRPLETAMNNFLTGNLDDDEAAQNLMTLYAQNSKQVRGKVIVNLWHTNKIMTDNQIGKMESILAISQQTNQNPLVIASQLTERLKDPAALDAMHRGFGSQIPILGRLSATRESATAGEFVRHIFENSEGIGEEAIRALTPMAQYLSATFSPEEIKARLKVHYDNVFIDTQGYIIDLGSRSGDRSRFALSAVIKDEGSRIEFINLINTELAVNQTGVSIQEGDITDTRITNRAYLMPLAVSTEKTGQQYLVVKRDGASLVAVIKQNGEPFGFAVNEVAASMALAQSLEDKAREMREKAPANIYNIPSDTWLGNDPIQVTPFLSGLAGMGG